MEEELLPPPPPKKSAAPAGEMLLPPPPPKKKGVGFSTELPKQPAPVPVAEKGVGLGVKLPKPVPVSKQEMRNLATEKGAIDAKLQAILPTKDSLETEFQKFKEIADQNGGYLPKEVMPEYEQVKAEYQKLVPTLEESQRIDRLFNEKAQTYKAGAAAETVKGLEKKDPVKRIKLYNQAIDNISQRLNDNMADLQQAKEAGDEYTVAQIEEEIKADSDKATYLQKAIDSQKQIAKEMEDNGLLNNINIGSQMALGTFLRSVNVAEQAFTGLKNSFWSELGFQPSAQYTKEYEEFLKDYEKGVKSSSDVIAKVGTEVLANAEKRNEVQALNIPHDGSAYKAMLAGDYSQMTEIAAKGFLKSLPSSLMYINPYSATALSMGMVGQQIDEGLAEHGNITATDVTVGALKASFEVLTEKMWGVGGITKDLIKSFGKAGAKRALIDMTADVIKKSFGRKWLEQAGEEFAGEGVNQFLSNVVDYYIDGKRKNKDGSAFSIWDGVPDAAIIGLAGAATQGTLVTAIQHVVDKAEVKKHEELKAKANQLVDMSLQQESPVVAEALEAKAEKLNDEADKIAEKQNEIGSNASPETMAALDEQHRKLDELTASLETLEDPDAIEAVQSAIEQTQAQADELAKKAKAEAIRSMKEAEDNKKMYQGRAFMDETGLQPGLYTQEEVDAAKAKKAEAAKPVFDEKVKETEDKIKRKDLFAAGGTFSNILGGSGVDSVPTSHSEVDGIEFVQFSNPETGDVDVVMTGTGENDFVGYYRVYENGKPTNKWSSKVENKSRNKQNFKTMMSNAQGMLPKGHEYTETTSISTDGLRVWNQQLNRGYEVQRDSDGNIITNEVAINGDAISNELGIPVDKGTFSNIKIKTKEDFEKVKKALLPYLEKLGLDESNIRLGKDETGQITYDTVKIDLPVLKSTNEVNQTENKPINQKQNEKDNEVRNVQEGQGNEGNERGQQNGNEDGQNANVQETNGKETNGQKEVTSVAADALKDVNSTAKALEELSLEDIPLSPLDLDKKGIITWSSNNAKSIAKAYHRAKKEGSNLELVEAVENLLKQKENAVQEPGTGEVLQRQSQEAGVPGSERTGVEQGQQGQEVAKEGSQEEVVPPTEGATTTLPAASKYGQPREMVYKDGKWQQKIGREFTEVSTAVQKEAEAAFSATPKSKSQVAAKGASMSSKSSIDDIKSRVTDAAKVAVINMAQKAVKTLKSVLPNFDIVVHETPGSYNESMAEVNGRAGSGGNFAFVRNADGTYSGRIDINLSAANARTVAHEVAHGIMLAAFGDKPALFNNFKGKIASALKGETNAKLEKFISSYSDMEKPEEYLAELTGYLADNQDSIAPSTWQKVAAIINDIVSKLTNGAIKPFQDLKNTKEIIEFFDNISSAIREGEVIDETNTLNGGGEIGTFNFTSKSQIKAPKASEDSRDFIRDLVEDLDIREFNGQKFVTNMYDYTTAGVADLGNGFKIDMLGGKNYVPYMMSKKNKKIGDVSNLAAFNTKSQAESFVRNAKQGKAELFAPHSGTLSASWQFQQHTFAELVNLLLDQGIMKNAELINVFNNTIASSVANQEAFEAFNAKYKEKNLRNFNSFKSDPKEIVRLLDIDNNYSPDLRKALNNAISADKTFQKAIGVKNKEQFFNKIMDPLNQGAIGGELINVVKFDPNTFEIVKTEPDAIDHHPSFGWTLLAKIDGIYQPTEFHKSSEVTNSYTKYNLGGKSVSRKATEPNYEKTNVSSSAGAIPKIAKFESKAQIVHDETGFISVPSMIEIVKSNDPSYLGGVMEHIQNMGEKLKSGKVTATDLGKAYLMAVSSIRSGDIGLNKFESAIGENVDPVFVEPGNKIRTEGAMAYLMTTDKGKDLLKHASEGKILDSDIQFVAKAMKPFGMFGAGESKSSNLFGAAGKDQINLTNIKEFESLLKGGVKDEKQFFDAITKLKGISQAKVGFVSNFLGLGTRGVIDAREIQGWLRGAIFQGVRTAKEAEIEKQLTKSNKQLSPLQNEILKRMRQVGDAFGIDPAISEYIGHHMIWDAVAKEKTTHDGLYLAMSQNENEFADKLAKYKSKSQAEELPALKDVEATAKALEGMKDDAENIFSEYKIQGYGSKFTYPNKINISRISDLKYLKEWVRGVNPNLDIDFEKNDSEYRDIADEQIDWNIKELSNILSDAKSKGYVVGKRIINTDGNPIDIKNIGHSFAVDDSNLPSFGKYSKLKTKTTVKIPFDAINLEATTDRFAYYGNGEYEIVVKPNEKLELLKYEEVDGNNKYVSKPVSKKEISSGFYRIAKQLSEAYHKAKAGGTNPELVKAVEAALGKTEELSVEGFKASEEGKKAAEIAIKMETAMAKAPSLKAKQTAKLSEEIEALKSENPEKAEVIDTIVNNIDAIRAQLLEAGIIESINCKWG